MADELPPAIQDFIADVDQYIGPLEEAIAVCEEFIAANERAAESALKLARDTEAMAGAAKDAASETADAAQASEHLATSAAAGHEVDSLKDAFLQIDGVLGEAIGMLEAADAALGRMGDEATKAGAQARAAFTAADDAADDAAKAFELAGKAAEDYEHGLIGLDAAQAAMAAAADAAAVAEFKAAAALRLAEEAANGAADADRGLAGAALEAAAANRVLAASAADAGRAISFSMGKLGEWGAKISDLRRYLDELSGAAKDIQAVGEAEAKWLNDKNITLLNAAISRLSGSMRQLYTDADGVTTEVASVGKAAVMTAGQINSVNESMRRFGDAADEADQVTRRLYVDSKGVATEVKAVGDSSALSAAKVTALNAAMRDLSKASGDVERGVAAAGKAAGAATGFWARWGNVIHWVVAGGVEILATAIPALVALGGAALVGMQGAQMLQEHLTALWTAAEATGNVFHQTMGTMLGMKSVLQQAQDAANPHIFALLGAGIGIVNEQAGKLTQAGSQVILVFDRFAARLQYDFSKAGGAGDTMNALLKAMVPDLIEFGQVFGNIGHALVNFASKMPGLAELLLKIADAASRVILAVSNLPTWLIMTAMAMEETWRWGQPLVAILTKLPAALAAFAASGFGVVPVLARIGEVFKALMGFIPNLVASFSEIIAVMAPAGSVFERAALAVNGFSESLANAIKGMTAWQMVAGVALVGAIVGVGIALTRTRSSVQQFDDSFNRMLATAKNVNVMTYIATDFQTATARIQQQTAVLGRYSGAVDYVASTNAKWTGQLRNMEGPLAGAGQGAQNLGDKINILAGRGIAAIPGMEGLGHAYEGLFTASHAAQAVQQLTAAQQQQVNAMKNTSEGMAYLQEKYHVTAQGALALADAAGVKLASGLTGATQAAVINRIMIEQLVSGYKAMGQGAGEVGTDMTALAIQSGLAASKVSQLNQAWDQFMAGLTGGTASLASFNIGIANMGQVVANAKNNLSKYTGSMKENVSAFAESLKSFSGKGAAAWQQFDQVVGSTAPQMIDWLRQAGQEGALGANAQEKFSRAVADISSKLVGFGAVSKPARAEIMGLASAADANITKWPQFLKWVDKTKGSAGDLGKTVGGATSAMENMGQVAQSLGNVMNNDLAKMMDAVKLKAYGVQQAFQNLGNQLAQVHPDAGKIAGSFHALVTKLSQVFGPAQGKQLANAFVHQFGDTIKNGMIVPIRNAHDGGAKTSQSLGDGLTSGKGHVTSAVQGIVQNINSLLHPLPGQMHAIGSQSSAGMNTGLESKLGAIHAWPGKVHSDVTSGLSSLPGQLLSLGVSAASGFLHGLTSMDGSIIAAAGHLGSIVQGAVAGALRSMSPSRVMMQQGEWAAQGLAIGITNGLPGVEDAARKLGNTVSGGLAIGTNGVPLAWESEKIGKDTIRQLIAGLSGSSSQIKAAIKDITDTVKKAFAAGKLNTGNWNSFLGEHVLLTMIGNDNKKLQSLAAQRQKIAKEIQAANQYASSVTSSIRQEAGLGNLTQPTDPTTGKTMPWTVTSVQSQLTSQLKQMQAFDHNIDVLKKEGLNKQMIAQIVAMGYQQGGALAQALAHGSASQIKDLNDTEKAILKASKKIGKDAADSMYDTGKQAGKGFLTGLKAEEKAIDAEVKKIADDIVKAIRKALRSHSPSMEMYDVGVDAARGLANGLNAGTPMVLAAARKMAETVGNVKVQIPQPLMTHPLVPVTAGGVNAGGPVVIVHQHIAGSVLSQQQLQQHTQTAVLQYAHRNPNNGLSLGRVSGVPAR